ncbi:MAG: porin family protein [Bacteroidota bacterium]
MKKKLLSIIMFSTILSTLLALPLAAQQMTGGIKGGLTMSNLYIDRDELDDENARFGFNLGLYSQFMMAETFGIQPELVFTTKGSEATYSGIVDQTVNFNLNYLEVPVLAVFRPLDNLELHAGPYVGLLLSSNIEYSGTIDGNDEIDRDNFNTLDYGIGAGLALSFGNISVGLRYNLGLQELANTSVAEMLLGDSKNSYGQLYIAFGFSEK